MTQGSSSSTAIRPVDIHDNAENGRVQLDGLHGGDGEGDAELEGEQNDFEWLDGDEDDMRQGGHLGGRTKAHPPILIPPRPNVVCNSWSFGN